MPTVMVPPTGMVDTSIWAGLRDILWGDSLRLVSGGVSPAIVIGTSIGFYQKSFLLCQNIMSSMIVQTHDRVVPRADDGGDY